MVSFNVRQENHVPEKKWSIGGNDAAQNASEQTSYLPESSGEIRLPESPKLPSAANPFHELLYLRQLFFFTKLAFIIATYPLGDFLS